jgi:hypothetical protein
VYEEIADGIYLETGRTLEDEKAEKNQNAFMSAAVAPIVQSCRIIQQRSAASISIFLASM